MTQGAFELRRPEEVISETGIADDLRKHRHIHLRGGASLQSVFIALHFMPPQGIPSVSPSSTLLQHGVLAASRRIRPLRGQRSSEGTEPISSADTEEVAPLRARVVREACMAHHGMIRHTRHTHSPLLHEGVEALHRGLKHLKALLRLTYQLAGGVYARQVLHELNAVGWHSTYLLHTITRGRHIHTLFTRVYLGHSGRAALALPPIVGPPSVVGRVTIGGTISYMVSWLSAPTHKQGKQMVHRAICHARHLLHS